MSADRINDERPVLVKIGLSNCNVRLNQLDSYYCFGWEPLRFKGETKALIAEALTAINLPRKAT